MRGHDAYGHPYAYGLVTLMGMCMECLASCYVYGVSRFMAMPIHLEL